MKIKSFCVKNEFDSFLVKQSDRAIPEGPIFSTPFGYFYKANIFLIDKQLTKSKINSIKE